MIRTQIYLPKPLWDSYRRQAKLRGAPAAQLIREALERDQSRTVTPKPVVPHKSWDELARELNMTGGPKDLSRRIDDYLYGDE